MGIVEIAPPAIWGFLVGFIGWGSCFRLVEPIGDWLVPVKVNSGLAQAFVRLLVAVFLIFTILMMLVIMPVFLFVSGGVESSSDEWRRLFGITFIGSLVGFFFFGLIRRLNCKV